MAEHLLTTSATRLADERAIAEGTPGTILMERAGQAVARAASGFSDARRVLAICGPGNNGGDGYVAARLLQEQGWEVTVAYCIPRDQLRGDAAHVAGLWSGRSVPLTDADPEAADLVIDAIFGAGLARDLSGEIRTAVERVNASRTPVLAVDMPSGIDGDTGEVRGVAIHADRTVTFVSRKPGHLLLPGRAHCGTVEVGDIGIGPRIVEAVAEGLYANGPDLWLDALPRPEITAHKYTRGHALVASGGATRTGAARLAARAALRIGAGLVTVASPPEALAVNAAHLTAIMLRGCDGAEGLAAILEDPRFNALVLGPALGVHAMTRAMVAVAVHARRGLVLDADALTSFEGYASDLAGVFEEAPTVLTPHEGEFSRLFSGFPEILEPRSKISRARKAAEFTGATVVLKGPDTVIAAPDGRGAVNENGAPYLATAGSGDVLSGMIAGLVAQGVPAFEAACAATWIHAEAGAAFGPGLIAEDIPELLPQVVRKLLK